jgi:hypothetical protein
MNLQKRSYTSHAHAVWNRNVEEHAGDVGGLFGLF